MVLEVEMARIIGVVLLSLLLASCSSQVQTTELGNWTWVFHDGRTLEFPDTWQLSSPDSTGNGLYLNDEFGMFYLVSSIYSHEVMEQTLLENNNTGFELDTETNIRILRAELSIESGSETSEFFDGSTEFLEYAVLIPDNTVVRVSMPLISEMAEREAVLQQVFQSMKPLHKELNTIGFIGGLAVMIYSNDWEIVTWSLVGWPELSNGELNLHIAVATETFWLEGIEETESATLSREDIILEILETSSTLQPEVPFSDLLFEDVNLQGFTVTVIQYEAIEYIVFQLQNGLWFRFSFFRRGSTLQSEDETIVMSLVESILANNRDTLFQPIEIAFPPQ